MNKPYRKRNDFLLRYHVTVTPYPQSVRNRMGRLLSNPFRKVGVCLCWLSAQCSRTDFSSRAGLCASHLWLSQAAINFFYSE